MMILTIRKALILNIKNCKIKVFLKTPKRIHFPNCYNLSFQFVTKVRAKKKEIGWEQVWSVPNFDQGSSFFNFELNIVFQTCMVFFCKFEIFVVKYIFYFLGNIFYFIHNFLGFLKNKSMIIAKNNLFELHFFFIMCRRILCRSNLNYCVIME